MTARERRDDRSVDDTQPVDPAEAEIRGHDRVVVHAHPARADGVIERLRPRAEMGCESLVVDRFRPGEQLAGDAPGKRGRARTRRASRTPSISVRSSWPSGSLRYRGSISGGANGSAEASRTSPTLCGCSSTAATVTPSCDGGTSPSSSNSTGAKISSTSGALAAGSTRTNAAASATFDVSGPRRSVSQATTLPRPLGAVEGLGVHRGEDPVRQVVTEVPTDRGRGVDDRDRVPLELLARTDPREQEQLRRVDRSRRQHDLARRVCLLLVMGVVQPIRDAPGPAPSTSTRVVCARVRSVRFGRRSAERR